jgi:hypothetical protein
MLKSGGIGIFGAIPYRFFATKAGQPSTKRNRWLELVAPTRSRQHLVLATIKDKAEG